MLLRYFTKIIECSLHPMRSRAILCIITRIFSWNRLIGGRFSIDWLFSPSILKSACWFERPFEEAGIFQVIGGMVKDKALGSDDFSMGFFLAYRDIVKDDVIQVLLEFYYLKKFEKCLNATIIALILKKHGAMKVKNFHPISLERMPTFQ